MFLLSSENVAVQEAVVIAFQTLQKHPAIQAIAEVLEVHPAIKNMLVERLVGLLGSESLVAQTTAMAALKTLGAIPAHEKVIAQVPGYHKEHPTTGDQEDVSGEVGGSAGQRKGSLRRPH